VTLYIVQVDVIIALQLVDSSIPWQLLYKSWLTTHFSQLMQLQ